MTTDREDEPQPDPGGSIPAAPTFQAEPAAVVVGSPAQDVARPRRRTKALAIGRRLAATALGIALFAGGAALGFTAYQLSLPPAPVVGSPTTDGIPAPPIVDEFVVALRANDADALRSAIQTGPYEQLAAEMQSWDLKEVTAVETLATTQDGPRSATALVVVGRAASDGSPVLFNLIVHVRDGSIVLFR